jgi:hypothetical protein
MISTACGRRSETFSFRKRNFSVRKRNFRFASEIWFRSASTLMMGILLRKGFAPRVECFPGTEEIAESEGLGVRRVQQIVA